MYTCSLCGKESEGFGNNPEPLKSYPERCCNDCNRTRVIPERLARINQEKN
jgi:DNA-directed RNA polymerase subunit RPC12/RpoP